MVSARPVGDYSAGSPKGRRTLPAKAVAHAMQLAGIVHGDGGPEDVTDLIGGLDRGELYAVAVTLAAMVDVDKTPAELLAWNDGPPRPVGSVTDAERFVFAVADYYSLPVGDLFGRDRSRLLVRARHVAMWLCVREANLTLLAVGRMFGRDHTTVLHGVRRVDVLLANGALRRESRVFPLVAA